MKGYIYTMGLVFSMMSLCTTLTVIFLHIKIPKLLKHPGQYVFIQCICQLFYDLHWCISFPRFDRYSEYSFLCKIEAIVLATACNLGILFVTVLGIELCIKFRFKGSIAYFKRSLIYNTVCILITLTIDIGFLASGEYYLTEFYTCSVSSLYFDIIESILCIICTAIMLFSLFYMMSNKKKNNKIVIKNFAFVIFFVIFTWILPSGITFINSYVKHIVYLKDAAYILGTISGICIGLSRIINYRVLRFFHNKIIKKTFQRSEVKTISLINMQDSLHDSFFSRAQSVNDFGEFYEDQSVKTFIEIMCVLSLCFYDKEEEPKRVLERKKSTRAFKLPNDPSLNKKSSKYNIHKQKIMLVEYQPSVFEFIRKQYFHTSHEIYESICDADNYELIATSLILNNSNGSMVFITSDQKYVIKVITKHEKSVFIHILLEPYMNRILSSTESKLVRILGLFQMKTSKIYFILMENTAVITSDSLRYDLKGSTVDRQVHDSKSDNIIMKDVNFLNSGIKVKIPQDTYAALLFNLTEDFKVLKTVGIMDYSLYLVCHSIPSNHIYPHYIVANCSVSIIDLFQLYDSKKAIERFLKIYMRCVKKHSLSSVSSDEYFQRILDFLPKVFEPD